MRSSRAGRYVLLTVAVVIALGGWMALKATERKLRAMKANQAPRAVQPGRLAAPRETGPMAGRVGVSGPGTASGPSGPSGATGAEAGTSPPASESSPRSGVPPGAIW